ncbi:unnamed protein product [Lactuca saligna]|uniref:Uncharacterized protein n=1 Tax=Lactuca saligna TaxID=75948 RepID=A0AA35VQQ9_LACSI|nr:unnamed protein product [Lactuca saligna]
MSQLWRIPCFLLSPHFIRRKIIVTDPINFSYIGSIPETMLGCISASSKLLQQYRKRKSVGPRDLTPTMLRSIEEANKPAKRGKKPKPHKEGPVTKPTKGKTPKKRRSDKAAPSQPQSKKRKKPARSLILQSSSDLDSEYVPLKQKNTPSSDSENKSSDEEASNRGDSPPRSPTPEILALFSSVVAEHSATLSATAKAIEASISQCQQASRAVDASTKECKEATAKVNKLVSQAQLFLDSL